MVVVSAWVSKAKVKVRIVGEEESSEIGFVEQFLFLRLLFSFISFFLLYHTL